MSATRERPPVERIVRPFQDFAHKQSSGSVLLIAAMVVALVLANSPWSESYATLWHTKLTIGVGEFSLSKDLTHWINDGLMAVFFLVVGLEIKREFLVGELYFAIMPLFALANAGVPLGRGLAEALANSVALGIVASLVVGKQLGITLFASLAVKSGVSELPEGLNWRHIYGAGWLAGIGFTMSLFISDLAFSDGSLVEAAKLGILVASLIAGAVGWTILRGASSPG